MPDFIYETLDGRGLAERYRARPPYQRNYYTCWITRAKTEATRSKRLGQTLDELKEGREYMGMACRAKDARRNAYGYVVLNREVHLGN